MTKKVNEKLKEMRDEGNIEKVEGATLWLSPLIAILKKTGDVRNTAVVRRRVQIPRVEGATVFTEADLSQGYLQLTLAEESRYITAFATPEDGGSITVRRILPRNNPRINQGHPWVC